MSTSSSDSSLRSYPSSSDLADDDVQVVQPKAGSSHQRGIRWRHHATHHKHTHGLSSPPSSEEELDADDEEDDKENQPSPRRPPFIHSRPRSTSIGSSSSSLNKTRASDPIPHLNLITTFGPSNTFSSSSSSSYVALDSPSPSPQSPPSLPLPLPLAPRHRRRSRSESDLTDTASSRDDASLEMTRNAYLDLASSADLRASVATTEYDSSEEDDRLEEESEDERNYHHHNHNQFTHHPNYPYPPSSSRSPGLTTSLFDSDSDSDDSDSQHIEHSSPSPPIHASAPLPPFTETRTGVFPVAEEDEDENELDEQAMGVVRRRLAEATAEGREWRPLPVGQGGALGLEGVWEDSDSENEDEDDWVDEDRPQRRERYAHAYHPSDAHYHNQSFGESSSSSSIPAAPLPTYSPLPNPEVRYKRVLVDLGLRLTPPQMNRDRCGTSISELLGEKWRMCDVEGNEVPRRREGSGLKYEVVLGEEE